MSGLHVGDQEQLQFYLSPYHVRQPIYIYMYFLNRYLKEPK